MALSTLRDILSKSAETEIGKKWNFASIFTLEDYRKRVPLTTYEVYRPYIDQMVTHGTENLIATGRVIFYAPTSGTLSKGKLFPRFSHPPKLSFPTDKKNHAPGVLAQKQGHSVRSANHSCKHRCDWCNHRQRPFHLRCTA